jgi:hypothetical protein
MVRVFGNVTGSGAIVWKAESTTRGTLSILISCISTLVLCVWSAVHLNIPEQPNERERPYLRKAKWLKLPKPHKSVPFIRKACWLVFGLLAPELVVFTAWYQHEKAKEKQEKCLQLWATHGMIGRGIKRLGLSWDYSFGGTKKNAKRTKRPQGKILNRRVRRRKVIHLRPRR